MMDYRMAVELDAFLRKICEAYEKSGTEMLRELGCRLKRLTLPESMERTQLQLEYEVSLLLMLRKVADLLAAAEDPAATISAIQNMRESLSRDRRALKIAFFVHEFSLWPSFQTVWEACGEDIERDLVLVYASWDGRPTDHEIEKLMKPYQEAGYPVRWMEDYNPAAENPDIVFFMKPYEGFRACPGKYYINEIEKITPYTVFISYCLDVQGGELLQEYFYGQPFFYHAWRIIGYSEYYRQKMVERGYRDGENVVLLGHPKFDVSFRLAAQRAYVHPEWESKIAGRKVILWNAHFTVEPGEGVGTYFLWKDVIFGYFRQHREMVLLWRPHPLFWESMERRPDVDEFRQLITQLETWDNVIIDQSGDYRYSFCMSDALISDAATFLVEYAASGKGRWRKGLQR